MDARFRLRKNGDGSYQLLVDQYDLSLVVSHAQIHYAAGKRPLVTLTVPAALELDIPADLTIAIIEQARDG